MATRKIETPVPSPGDIARCVEGLEITTEVLGDWAVALSPTDRQRELKLRRGGERFVPMIMDLGARYGVSVLGAEHRSATELLDLVARLDPLAARLRAMTDLVTTTIMRARADAWQAATATYTALSRVSSRNPSLLAELAPATAFFAIRRRGGGSIAEPPVDVEPAVNAQPVEPQAAVKVPAGSGTTNGVSGTPAVGTP